MNSPLAPYLPMAVALLVSGVLALVMPGLASLLGPRRPSAIKSMAFEAGSETTGPARQRFAVKFYVIALLFIIFDVEAVFLYPWAVNFQALGWFGYWEMVVFAATLVVGLIYIWKKGALDWES
ncbi:MULTISPECIES: NADH-quinone oxidoreductase subunit A [Stigmatella]|uniref:NADH-quinone oxidoreductase subunit A n=2 Tax=Stigmatella TaxID=40 RepID=A0A1H7UUT6_STIAU|nr:MULTISPECIES: NADH-quinone oxidoreductase subunit A [Stigmatella]SEM00733.1 NADH dehydrogenase subunit A [Stigmatella aurantiaca]SET47699.1 NADH dehydrogenase subunit A [Stigmatella erecta]